MNTPRAFHLSSILPDGTVLVVGGGPTGNRDDQLSAERFYPDRNSWAAAGSTQLAHTRGTATLLTTGFVLVSGGVEYESEAENPTEYVTGYSEKYDWQSNSWSELAVMGHTTFDPGFPGWIAPAGLKAAETLTKLPIPYFHPSGPSEFGYLIQRKGLI